MVNTYLVVAFFLLWAVFVLYAVVIHSRQRRLEKEIEELKTALRERSAQK